MESNFFAYLSRMKLIRRWSLMRSVQPENIQEHSHQVAVLAHALCEIENVYFQGACDGARAALLALYHDVGEVIIGDLPTPVKYYNPDIKRAYGEIEDMARESLLAMLPAGLEESFRPLITPLDHSREAEYVRAADKLSAYIKCREEISAGNREFSAAEKSIRKELEKFSHLPALGWFMDQCLNAYSRTLDELG